MTLSDLIDRIRLDLNDPEGEGVLSDRRDSKSLDVRMNEMRKGCPFFVEMH